MATQVTLNSGSVDSAGSLALKTNGTTTAVTINTSQNVGIGVTPAAWGLSGAPALQIKNAAFVGYLNDAYMTANTYFDSVGGARYIASANASFYAQTSGQHQWFTAASGTAGAAISLNQAMTLDASGNLGIGITSPVSPLTAARGNVTGAGQWASSAIAVYNPTNTGSYSQISFGYTVGTTNAAAYIGYVSTNQGTNGYGDLVFGTRAVNTDTQPTERARIDSSGNLLVGTNSTFGTGPVQIQSATSGQLSLRNSAASAGAHWRMGPDSSANDLILYSSNASGGVYIGNASTSWSGRSDERLKDIIEPITDAANKVSNLRAVIGKFKTDEEGTRRSFLIAQDVQAVLPEAVSVSPRKEGEDTDYLGVAYTDVIPLLVAAIKEQQALITTLTARITALEQA
jgi:hypothetical protein